MTTFDEVLSFWLEESSPADWYKVDPAFDQTIRERFEEVWQAAAGGTLGDWLTGARSTLAYIILTDQFPRNMFRGEARAFATDEHARSAAKRAIDRKWDMEVSEPARQFFYLPLMHAENLTDQDRAVRLIHSRMPETGSNSFEHAQAHRNVIRNFGRFPYRNDALDRTTTEGEQAFLDAGGYSVAIRAVQQGNG